ETIRSNSCDDALKPAEVIEVDHDALADFRHIRSDNRGASHGDVLQAAGVFAAISAHEAATERERQGGEVFWVTPNHGIGRMPDVPDYARLHGHGRPLKLPTEGGPVGGLRAVNMRMAPAPTMTGGSLMKF